jgi:hypothetical protein
MLAVAAGALISPALMAADVATPSITAYVSDEYLSTSPSTEVFSHPAVGFTIEAEYAVGDIINLSFSGSALDETTLPSSIEGGAAPTAIVTLGLLSATTDGATYRVTEVDTGTGNTTVGIQFDLCSDGVLPNLPPCDFNANAVDANNGVVLGFSAETGTGLALDTGGGADRSTALFITGSQFAPEVVSVFNGIVDVNQNREEFTDGTTDGASFNVSSSAVTCGGVDDACEIIFPIGLGEAVATPLAQDVTITSDFSWVFDDDDTTAGLQPAADVFTLTNCGGPTAYSATAITSSCDFDADVAVDIDVAPNATAAGGGVVLPATSFVSTHVLNYEGSQGTASSITVNNVSLGAWKLNGFQSQVAYMPYQTGIGQIIYLANRSSQAGAITVDWIDQFGNSGSFDAGTVAAGSTIALADAIRAGLPAEQRQGGRLALTITANVPACDAQLNAQYNVSGDRAFSVATDNCPVETAQH